MSVGVLHRGAVRVTWQALRGRALWPGWQEPDDADGAVAPEVAASGRIWAAVLERGHDVGLSFGCGTFRDGDGEDREAACHVTGMEVLSCPNQEDGDSGEIVALVGIESEAKHGPNSFELGRELKWRLTGANWQYASGGVAAMHVVRVEAYAEEAGAARWLPIHPPRRGLL